MADKSFWSDKKDKKWLGNFWYYYRTHVIVTIIVLLVIGFSVRECAMHIDPDISVSYIGKLAFSDETAENFEQYFAPMIKDTDNKDGNNVQLVQRTVVDTENGGDAQMAMAIQQSVFIEMSMGESYLYLIGDEYIQSFVDAEILTDLSEFTNEEKGTYYIDVHENKLFCKLFGEYGVPVYMCVRSVTPAVREKDVPKAEMMHDNAIIMFNEFLKYQ